MTEEEIEKQAEKYAIQNYGTEDVVQSNLLQAISKDSFKDGAKWGMEHAVEWHDLRENPSDLPKKDGQYWCYVDNDIYDNYGFIAFYDERWMVDRTQIIAWCELPQFKDKE